MLELDDVVRANQVACLPFAKSGRAESELFERYPELFGVIERGKRAKIDSFRLQSTLRDEESYHTRAGKGRPVSMYDGGDNPSGDSTGPIHPDHDMTSKKRLERQKVG